ncbi:flavin-containing protein [Fusarium heterosporum]|uniref:Flavin-containing protein n=1 Tax=Fusarium heterosporum TaxID=42747 RepID=A0A8H5TD27_FUSHE|nr:flavin-containing protein [Fusarium heterosporum]
MSFSDAPFSYGPFVPHYVPRQYIESYFSVHKTDEYLSLNTTVEDLSQLPTASKDGQKAWRLTLRRYDPLRRVDVWWREDFDAVILANGHYAVPWVPKVQGLEAYMERFPGRVMHSKFYRSPWIYANKKVLVIGNSASGHDIAVDLRQAVKLPLYQSRRSRGRLDGDGPPPGVEWKTVIKEYRIDGSIVFEDGTELADIDHVIYCTGYLPSYPFWNSKANGRPLFDYENKKLINNYWHTFIQDIPNLAVIGMPRVLTFRSFEYQAVAVARLFSGRNTIPLPPIEEQRKWERSREQLCRQQRKKFHEIEWEAGETFWWLDGFFQIAGLGTLGGDGRIPPALSKDIIWAIENIRKYPVPGKETNERDQASGVEGDEWILVDRTARDLLSFI